MTKIEQHSAQINKSIGDLAERIRVLKLRSYPPIFPFGDVEQLATSLDLYRAEVGKELEGLRGDVKSAETAYEREKIRADGLEQEKDRWTNECLPGWRKRVTEAERQRDQWKNDHDRIAKEKHQLQLAYDGNVNELKALAYAFGEMEKSRDDWKRDANLTDDRLENTNRLVGTLKNENDSLKARLEEALSYQGELRDAYDRQKQLTHESCQRERDMSDELYAMRGKVSQLEAQRYELFGAYPGSAEGDKTVIAWTCACGVERSFTAPKLHLGTHDAPCQCGAVTKLNYAHE